MCDVCGLEVPLGDWPKVERWKTLVLGVYAAVGYE
jgi:hypothetical protein